LFVAALALLAAVSLSVFYVIPRYEDEDYRPLIGQVMQYGRASDTVFAVFPWQVGYFWSYGSPEGPQPELTPDNEWSQDVAAALDGALGRGRIWFPMHQSLGAILEGAVEQHLALENYQLANRWYSPSTRLTGWAAPEPAPVGATPVAASAAFEGGVLAEVSYAPRTLSADNDVLPVRLAFAGLDGQHLASLRLTSPDGRIWAQRDVTLDQDGEQQIGLLAPAGMPAGRYDLKLSLAHPDSVRPISLVEPAGAGVEWALGSIDVQAPATPPPVSTLPMEHAHEAIVGNAAQLLGHSDTPGPLLPGNDLTVNLFWRALPGAADADLSAFVQLLDRQGQVVAGWEGPPVPWHPSTQWQPGELLRSQHALRLSADLAEGRYTLAAGLFDPATGKRVPVTESGRPFGLFSRNTEMAKLGQVRIGEHDLVMTPPEPRVTTDASMQRMGKLVGYDLAEGRVAPGEALELTLYWQPVETAGDRLTVFVHLLDEQGVIIGQSDGEPAGGSRPTSSWLPGEYIADQHSVRVRDDALLGSATLVVGLYDAATGQRIAWVDESGQVTGDSLRLPSPVRVTTLR
jgi:hypothetical protein